MIVIDLTSDAPTSQLGLMAVTEQAYILVVGELCRAMLFHPTQISGLPVFLFDNVALIAHGQHMARFPL
jgi:hypothetical protein